MKTIIEPFRIKSVEPIRMTTEAERRQYLEAAGYNLFRIPAEHVIIDLLTDSGTGAMSSGQWAGVMRGDESYAGAPSYYRFLHVIEGLTGFSNVLPTHQGRASERILVEVCIGSGHAGRGMIVPNNAHFDTTRANIEHSTAETIDLLTEVGRCPQHVAPFKGDMDVEALAKLLDARGDDVPFVMLTITCNSNGGQPVSLENMRRVREVCDRYEKRLILDACRFAENAWFIKQREPGQADRSVRDIVRDTFDLADGATISAKKDGLVNTGGVLLLRDADLFHRASNLLILTEGFLTYGGLAGRDLEAMAIGFEEVLDEDYLRYRVRSVQYFGDRLTDAGISIVRPPGGHAIYLDAADFCPHIPSEAFPGQAVVCGLYEIAGIRACEIGSLMMGEHAVMQLVRLAVPRRTYTQSHIDYVIEAILKLKERADELTGYRLTEESEALRHFTARLEQIPHAMAVSGEFLIMQHRAWAEPYKIKMIEHLRVTTRPEREAAIAEAGFNTFLLRSADVYIDLLTDSGTSAMSDVQWAGMLMGDEAYAGSRNFYHLEEAVRRHYGYRNVIPSHQGRGAEHILSQLCIREGDYVPGNMYFTTTKFHQELAGARFVDVIVDEAHDPESTFPFKGNVDLAKLQRLIDEVGADRIPYISLETNVNMAGGQPCSLENIRATSELCHQHDIRVFLDATRAVENCYFIKQREPGYEDWTLAEILREICRHTDGCTMSAKKDCLVNIGGFLAVNDDDLAESARNMCVVFEGLHTYGGMAGRDLEALAIGIEESVSEAHMRARIGQVEYLGQRLLDARVPIVKPIGGHGVFVNASAFLEHVPREQLRAQALAAALYVDSGVRAMERGSVSAGRDRETGENLYPSLELVRLTIPRRVYTQAHMDVVADSVISLYERRRNIVGLRFTYEPKRLRFFQAQFEPVVGTKVLNTDADTDGNTHAQRARRQGRGQPHPRRPASRRHDTRDTRCMKD